LTKKIAVIPGDGIGPEVIDCGMKILERVNSAQKLDLQFVHFGWNADEYLGTGVSIPPGAMDDLRKNYSAVYLGAFGDPRIPDMKHAADILLGMRFKLDLYVNLRPVKLFDERFCPLKYKTTQDVDMIICRENTEDAYAGIHGFLKKGTPDEVAQQVMVYTRKGVERIIRYAFERAKTRPRKKVTLVDKANAVRAQDIWTRVFAEVAKDYPGIETDHAYIDAACMWMVKNPEWFDVVVLPNLFGDILTDLGAIVQGGMGIAASGNIHPGRVSMFEPIHGSAPKYKGLNKANPLATIMAVSMMLDYLGERDAAESVEHAVAELLRSGRIQSLNAGVHPTDEIGRLVAEALQSQQPAS
jgi:3-isopropylmalate dehydrogenase